MCVCVSSIISVSKYAFTYARFAKAFVVRQPGQSDIELKSKHTQRSAARPICAHTQFSGSCAQHTIAYSAHTEFNESAL